MSDPQPTRTPAIIGFLIAGALILGASFFVSTLDSEHPLGEAIVIRAKDLGLELPATERFASITGKGIEIGDRDAVAPSLDTEVEDGSFRAPSSHGQDVYADDVVPEFRHACGVDRPEITTADDRDAHFAMLTSVYDTWHPWRR